MSNQVKVLRLLQEKSVAMQLYIDTDAGMARLRRLCRVPGATRRLRALFLHRKRAPSHPVEEHHHGPGGGAAGAAGGPGAGGSMRGGASESGSMRALRPVYSSSRFNRSFFTRVRHKPRGRAVQ